jgi:hypothetical protein
MSKFLRCCVVVAFGFAFVLAAGAEWQTNYDKALRTAKTQGKLVFINFTGSD